MTETAQARFTAWVRAEIVPFLRSRGFGGSGRTFSQRIARDWLIVYVEKSRHSDSGTVLFRVSVGVGSAAIMVARGEDPDRRPSAHRLDRMFGPPSLYDPPGGDGWFRLGSSDSDATADDLAKELRALLRDAIEDAAGRTGDAALLDARLSMMGPLENASPHQIGELVALARSIGDDDVLRRIAELQDRPRVPDPWLEAERRRGLEIGLEIAGEMGGSVSLAGEVVTPETIDRLTSWEPPDFHLPTGEKFGRLSRRRVDSAVADLTSTRVDRRRYASWELGGVPSSPEVVEALRAASLRDHDRYVRQAAIQSLGLLGDPDPGTWRTAIETLEREGADEDGGGVLTAYGAVELALLDPSMRRDRARSAIERLLDIDLAWRRSYRLLLDRLADSG